MPVTVESVELKLGRSLTVEESVRVEEDIADAYAVAEAQGWISEPETVAQSAVIRRVVLRAFRNPEGTRPIQQESLGSRSVSYVATGEQPGIYFTAQDVADMRGRRSSVYSIRLTTPADHL